MLKAETILYPVHNGLYVNLTNRCSCACTFCIRQSESGVGLDGEGGENILWLEHEPTFEEVMDAFDKQDMDSYEEVVFCGFGEPTCAFDVLKRVAREVKSRYNLPVRVNTNGQGSLINERDIAPEFEGIVDVVSISLNTPNADEYRKLTRSKFGDAAWDAMLKFAREVHEYVSEVVMTTVETTISREDEEKCKAICDDLGVRYRIRAWVD